MIIRRRHTSNFTVVTNDVFNDSRLTIEERGALGWLISRPHNWEVSRQGCAKLWNVGRDKARRILRRLVETGWAKGEMVREETTGTFVGMRYTITDECGPEQAFQDDDGVTAAEEPETQNASVDNEPRPEYTSVDDHHALETPQTVKASPVPLVSTESITKTYPTLPKQEGFKREISGEQSEEAEKRYTQFQSNYPKPVLDPARTRRALFALSETDQIACVGKLAAYAEHCRASREKPMKAHVFIQKRSWEGLGAVAARVAALDSLHDPRSPAGRSIAVLCRIGGVSPMRSRDNRLIYRHPITPRLLALADAPPEREWRMPETANHHGAWCGLLDGCLPKMGKRTDLLIPWPWPPRVDGTLSPTGPSESTGPPDSLMTAEDERDFLDGQRL
jgi:hypothetical protein